MSAARTVIKACLGLNWIALIALILVVTTSHSTKAADRHAGYYYPKPTTTESYRTRAETVEGANKRRRVAFIVGISNKSLSAPYPPTVSMFAKGRVAEKLIIVGAQDGRLNTIYRIRAYLATLTSVSRALPVFKNTKTPENLTFFDLAKMLGFEQVTISDGISVTHQVILK